MMQSEQTDALAAALAKAQGEIGGAAKAAENPHFRSKYATLEAVIDAMRQPFATNGLAVYQAVRDNGSGARLVTRILHGSGQWIEDDGMPLLLDKQNMQGLGSALTYSRRYGLMAAAGVAPSEDDDGNAAVKNDAPEGKAVKVAEKISAGQKDHLIRLMQEVGADTTRFLKHLGIKYIDDLPASRAEEAAAALETKRSEKALA